MKILFSEKVGLILQSNFDLNSSFSKNGIKAFKIGFVNQSSSLKIGRNNISINEMRKEWMKTSTQFELKQTNSELALLRLDNVLKQPLKFKFPIEFDGKRPLQKVKQLNAAVIREKGSNSEREMAYMMDLCGFKVRDVHMTDLIEGRETLEDIQLLVAVGGFSNSDLLGSAKGWAGAFKYNTKAKAALENFLVERYSFLGVCNGCQLFIELGLFTQIKSKAKNDA